MFSEHLHKEPSEREYCKNCTLPAYGKVLDEIKEMAKELKNECFYDDFECKDCDMSWRCTYVIKQQILQLIKQAKEGGEQ